MSFGKRTCLECGEKFEAAYAAQLCCGETCRRRRHQNFKNVRAVEYRKRNREELERLRKLVSAANVVATERKIQKLRVVLEKVARRKRFLESRCKELVAQVSRQGEEISVLRVKLARAEEMQQKPATKNLDAKLKAAREQVASSMRECTRMKARGTSLPCGKRVECFEGTRCEHVPAGARFVL